MKNIESRNITGNVSRIFFLKHPKLSLSLASLGGIAILSGCSFFHSNEETDIRASKTKIQTEDVQPDVILPEYLEFDANDNESLIEYSAQFIANSRACGIDFSSEKDIAKYMDLYLVANIDYIDPVDYARLQYNNKTTQSIIDNYQDSINEISYDLFTVTPDTMLSYDFIADKDSKEILMKFQELIANYNVEEDKTTKKELAKSIEQFLVENFINEDTRGEYTHVTYEMIGRFALIADEILPKGLSEDVTHILCEDLFTCDEIAPEGEKAKSERAQAETSLRDMLDDKLATAREYRDQDILLVSSIEQLTGVAIEQKIAERVAELNVEFVANPDMASQIEESTNTNSSSSKESTTLSNGYQVSTEQIESLGLDPATVTPQQYESAVQQQFEQNAQNDPNHKLENADGVVVGTGADATYNAAEANQGATDAFFDGYNGAAFSPKSQTPSYLAGYTHDSYNQGVAARAELNNNMNNGNSSYFESAPSGTVETVDETITEQGYTSSPSPSPSPNSQETETHFESVPSGTVETVGETIVEEGYIETETHFEPIASTETRLMELKTLKDMLMAYSFVDDTELEVSQTLVKA